MSKGVRRSMLAALTCAALAAAGSSTPSSLARKPAPAVEASAVQPRHTATDGTSWLSATQAALDAARKISLPFAELGDLDNGNVAAAYAFQAHLGQTLAVELRRPAGSGDPIYVEVFRVVDVLGQALHERLAALPPGSTSVKTKLPSDGVYHVLVQSGAKGGVHYGLKLELTAALPFPVVGAEADSIRSLFGASRDAGRRHHEGVDIFVRRLTPVLAVAAGSAMPRQDSLGGNTVWLNTPGTSYYYAHLDRVAVKDQQRVKVGDVLGYVGNTGNATGMPSHLHFGVYRWGKEPIDPLPLLLGQRFEREPAAPSARGAGS
jgi:murein DD-endopeptidase MepM/ murein hydrolase activator NlpD